jgi:hypothetical protein
MIQNKHESGVNLFVRKGFTECGVQVLLDDFGRIRWVAFFKPKIMNAGQDFARNRAHKV